MKYNFISKAEVYNALYNLSEEGGAALNFRKSLHRLKIKKFTSIPHFFYQNNFPLITQKFFWKIRSKQMSVDATCFLKKTR